MSKSIYDEALKESKDFGSFVGLKLDKVNNALEQAQKQEKLLELYKKLSEAYADYNSSFDSYGNRFQDNLTKIYEIKKQIKELENE